ncbi:MAG: tetratricopeptide repeat protein, partial [Muribaculaceae bacterium]|nr:tetratricopeptide repeat protein [Muribaculaceae bacterium]
MKRYGVLLISLVYCILWLLAAGCGGGVRHDSRLTEIERLSAEHSDTAAATAVSRLELIDRSALSESDRRYYDFLRVKTADKAYITHTSDSLILSVIDYAASHRRELSYPEALYYGGRVYSDLGDYPTALRYFQQALDEMPESDDRKFLNLKGTVLSQTGRLLNTLRLYQEAVPYIEKAIDIAVTMKDSVPMMQDIQLLGSVYLRAEKYDTAEIKFRTAYNIAEKVSPVDCYTQQMYLGVIKYDKGQLDSALSLIGTALDCMDTLDRNYAMGYLGDIYLKKGKLDSAFTYARHLIWDKDSYNRPGGYKLALNSELRKFIPEDSLDFYLDGYWNLLQESLDNNESRNAVLQNSLYNYQLHERERVKAENSRDRLRLWLVVIVLSVLLVISLLVGVIIYQKARNRKSLLRLHDALDRVSLLRYSLDSKEICLEAPVNDSRAPEIKRIDSPLSETEQLRIMKERLRKELMSLADESGEKSSVSDVILSSAACAGLREYLERDIPVPENSALWEELEETVSLASVHFRDRINLLTGDKLKPGDYHTVLLLKCGFTPTQISKLLG